jgi:putative flippase GtrA
VVVGSSRFVRFNAVGLIGFVVQLLVLALLLRAGLHYLAATAIAVEVAILHNFLWHERWTWRERAASGRARLAQLGRFHLLNGLTSLIGNLLLMRLLVGTLGVPAVPANLAAVTACSLVNFFASDRAVFRSAIGDSGFAMRDSGSAIRD